MITVFWLDLTWPEPIFMTAYLLLHACLQQGEYASLQHQRDVSTHQTKVLLQWHSKHWLGHRIFWTTHTASACQVSFDFSKQHIQLQPVKWVFWTTHTTSACQVSFLNNTYNFSLSSEFSEQHIQLQPVKWVFWTTQTSACQVNECRNQERTRECRD